MKAPGQHRLGSAVIGWLVLPMVLALLWGQPKDGRAFAWCLGNGALGMLAAAVAIVVHEVAHAVAALLLRLELGGVWIGIGPELGRRRVRGVEVIVHAIPTAGWVVAVSRSRRWLRTRVWWMTLAGPAANLAIALPLLSWLASTGRNVAHVEFSSGLAWWLVLAATNLGVGALNLFPFGTSDGARLLSGLFGRIDADTIVGVAHLWGAERAQGRGQLGQADADLTIARPLLPALGYLCDHTAALVALERGEVETAVRSLRALRDRPEVPAALQSTLQNNLAWALLMRGHADDRVEALALSAAALAAHPRLSAPHGTRGAALIAAGRAVDGLPHCQRALAGATTDRARAANHAWIAIAHAQLGDLTAARASLAEALRLQPDHPLVARVEAAIAVASAG